MSAFFACGVMLVSVLKCLPNYKYGWNKRRILLRIPFFCMNFGLLILCLLGHNDSVTLLFYGTLVVSAIVVVAHEMYCRKKNVWTSKAAVGFRYCTKLFSLEKKCCDADGKSRKDYRQNVVWPLLEEYFAWLKGVHLEKGSKLEDAVRYSLNQKQQLMAFLDHGEVPISNNLAENAVRPFVMGRKNWLFCDSVKGRNPVPLCVRW